MERKMEEEKLMNGSVIYINGAFYPKSEAKISVYDHGLLYGDGVFEEIRAYNGIIFKLKEHIERLYRSAKLIMLEIPMEKEEMIKVVRGTCIGDLGLDPRKCPRLTVIIIAEPTIKYLPPEAKEKGITAAIVSVRRDPVDATSHEVKSLNYLNNILAKIEAINSGVNEAIMLDNRGFVSEGVGENIFIVKDGKIITPPTSAGILPGITRELIMNLAKKLGYEVSERDITPNELFNAEEVFFTGTAIEMVPVREINKRVIGQGEPGPITKHLMKEFEKITRDPSQGTPIY
jgi:branched-chain amino acid aminotransferase